MQKVLKWLTSGRFFVKINQQMAKAFWIASLAIFSHIKLEPFKSGLSFASFSVRHCLFTFDYRVSQLPVLKHILPRSLLLLYLCLNAAAETTNLPSADFQINRIPRLINLRWKSAKLVDLISSDNINAALKKGEWAIKTKITKLENNLFANELKLTG